VGEGVAMHVHAGTITAISAWGTYGKSENERKRSVSIYIAICWGLNYIIEQLL